jgi:hypothetical protein
MIQRAERLVVVVVNVGKVVRQQPSVSAADRPDQHRGPVAEHDRPACRRGRRTIPPPLQPRPPVPPVGLRLRQKTLMAFLSERRINMGA